MPITFRRHLGAGNAPALVLARRLRSLIEDATAGNPEIQTNEDFANLSGVKASTLSSALGGEKMPSPKTVRAILDAVSADTATREEVLALFPGGAGPVRESTTWLVQAATAWQGPDIYAADYRAFTKLLEESRLDDVVRMQADGLLAEVPDVVWAFVVTAAVQHGSNYLSWFEDAQKAGREIPVAEALVERLLSSHTRPSWRAAWLLQQASPKVRYGAVSLAADLGVFEPGGIEDRRLHAIQRQGVVELLASLDGTVVPDHHRDALLKEFRLQRRRPIALGRLADVVSKVTPPDPKTCRDFNFVARRTLELLKLGQHHEVVGPDKTLEGLHNRRDDLRRLLSPVSLARPAMEDVAALLTTAAAASDPIGEDQATEIDNLIARFNEAVAQETHLA